MKRPLKSSRPWGISTPEFPRRGDRTSPLAAVLIGLILAATACAGNGGDRSPETPVRVVDRWGTDREYRVFLPDHPTDAPLLVYFHGVVSEEFKEVETLRGYTGSPVEETGLIPFCRSRGIVLLAPRPAYTYRFLGKTARGWLPYEREMDGIERIISAVIQEFHLDPGRVYLAGISAGAGICHHLANRQPDRYRAILSHSQGYLGDGDRLLSPCLPGPRFGVLFCYNRGDYDNLVAICEASEKRYRERGYRTVLLRDLPPEDHRWSGGSNPRFWRILEHLGRASPQSTQRSGSQP